MSLMHHVRSRWGDFCRQPYDTNFKYIQVSTSRASGGIIVARAYTNGSVIATEIAVVID